MPWVTKTGFRTRPDGEMVRYTYKVFVKPKATKVVTARDEQAAMRREQAERRKVKAARERTGAGRRVATPAQAAVDAAKREALRKAKALAAKRREIARRRLWRNLEDTALGIRGRLAPNIRPGKPMRPLGMRADADASRNLRGQPALLTERERTKQVEAAAQQASHWAEMTQYYKKREQRRKNEAAFLKATKGEGKGTPASAAILEKLLIEARDNQVATGGKDLDQEFVMKVMEAYDAHVIKVRQDYQAAAEKLSEFYVIRNGRVVGFKKGGEEGAKRYRESAKFKALQKEYYRLHGDSRKKNDLGSSWKVQNAASEIAQNQRNYTRDIAYDAFFKGQRALLRPGATREERAQGMALAKDWNEKTKWLFEASIDDIDPAKTSFITVTDPETGKPRVRRRTVPEEFEWRKAQYQAEMTRQANEAMNKAKLQRQMMQRYGKTEFDGGRRERLQAVRRNTYLKDAMTGLGFEERDVKDRTKVISIVDEAMVRWEKENIKYWQNARGKRGLGIVDEISGQSLISWARAKEQQRAQFYHGLMAENFGIGDFAAAAVQVPVIRELTTGIAAFGGSILSGARVVLKVTTGSSTINLPVNLGDIPKHVIAEAKRSGASDILSGAAEAVGMGEWRRVNLYVQNWISNTPEGQRWLREFNAGRAAKSQAEDIAFAEDFYSEGHDIQRKAEALASYGGEVTSHQAINLVLQLAIDPTVALPMKFTTWPARMQYAVKLARQAGQMKILGKSQVASTKLNQSLKFLREFQKVDESTLRFQKGLEKFKASPNMAEAMLDELAGMRKKGATQRDIEKKFRDWGIDPKSTDGKLLMNDASRAIVERLKAKGVNYVEVAEQIQVAEAKRLKDVAEAAAQKSKGIEEIDAKRLADEAAAKEVAEEARATLNIEREAHIDVQLAKAEAALTKQAPAPTEVRVPGDVDGTFLASRRADPLRQAIGEANIGGGVTAGTMGDVVRKVGPGQAQADFMQAVSGRTGVFTDHGVEFAETQATFALRGTDEYKAIIATLDAFEAGQGRIIRTGDPEQVRKGVAAREKYNKALRQLRDLGRESIYAQMREQQSIGRAHPLDDSGQIPWRTSADGVSYQVAGARKSSQQHITTEAQAATLAGSVSPVEDIAGRQLSEAMEKLQRAAVTIYAKHEKAGTLGSKEFLEEMQKHVRRVGVQRTSSSTSVDLRSTNGALIYSQLDHFLASDYPGWLPIGEILYHELMSTGSISKYYETLSLIPEMMRGVGYETPLMASIKNPYWRAGLNVVGFAGMMRQKMFLAPHPGPAEYRQAMSHLFALFHLTKLDAEAAFARLAKHEHLYASGQIDIEEYRRLVELELETEGGAMQQLFDYSKAMQRILDKDPFNMYARGWQVMEARAGVFWAADPLTNVIRHTDVEQAFISAALHVGNDGEMLGRLYPELALKMIPPGPIARAAPISHGYRGFLKAAAYSTSRLFQLAPIGWVDKHVYDALTRLATKNMSIDDAVILANKISHYQASRYGLVTRRKQFTSMLYDYNIEAVFRKKDLSPKAYSQFRLMRERYIEAGLDKFFERGGAGSAAEKLGADFDEMFLRSLPKGMKRRDFDPTLRAIFEESYWRGEITHSNIGLHTSFFLTKMADPTIQRGDSWVRYANAFYDHMVGAGAESQAREVIRELFVDRIAQVNGNTFDAVVGLEKSNHMLPGVWYGSVREFLTKVNLLGDVKRAVAEGAERTPRDAGFAEEQAALEQLHDDFFLADEAHRSLVADPNASMYAYADIGHIADDVGEHRDDAEAALRDISGLAYGESAFRVALNERDMAALAFDAAEARVLNWLNTLSPVERRFANVKPDYYLAAEKALDEAQDAVEALAARYRVEEEAIEALATAERELADLQAKTIVRLEGQVAEAQVKALADANAAVKKAQAKVDKLLARPDSARALKRAPVSRPSDARMAVYETNFRRISSGNEKNLPPSVQEALTKAGVDGATPRERALAYLRTLPDDARPWVVSEIRLKKAQRGMRTGLNTLVLRTIELGSIPTTVGDEMRAIVDMVKSVPGGDALLRRWANEYYTDLLNSRLIDYLQHEDWFEFQAVTGGVDPAIAEVSRLVGEMTKLTADRPLAASDEATAAFDKRLAALQTELDAARAKAAARVETRPAAEAPPGEFFQPTAGEEGFIGPRQPTADELNHGRIRSSTEGLEILRANTEEQWLTSELAKAKAVRSKSRGAARAAANRRVVDIERAFKVIEIAKAGGKGKYITVKNEKSFVTAAMSLLGERARESIAPRMISPYLVSAAGATTEQGRSLLRLLNNSGADQSIRSAVRRPGEVSATYAKHGDAIEKRFDVVIPRSTLNRHGLHVDADITRTQLLTELDEFSDVMRNSEFKLLVNDVLQGATEDLKLITGDDTYGIERWLDDRLVHGRGGFLEANIYEEADRRIEAAWQAISNGERRMTRTDLRREPGSLPGAPVAEMFETDVRKVAAKAKVLAEMKIDPHAYNEARRVLRPSYLKKKYGLWIAQHASNEANAKLFAAGKSVRDADWDVEWRKAYDEAFLAKRAEMAGDEAEHLLELLIKDELMGATNAEIIAAFESRYGLDNVVKGQEAKLTPFQRRTLEEAVKTHLGVDDLNDHAKMMEALSRHGQAPPFHNREAMRDWLVKYGFWSPRTAEMIEAGKKSWSIQEEAKFYMDSWGRVPDWANPELLKEGGSLNHLLFDSNARADQFQKWGLFNRNMEARFAAGKMTRLERARFYVEGNLAMKLKGKRDLDLERRYVMERYGELVSADGKTLTGGFPELMTRTELENYIWKVTKEHGELAEGMVEDLEELQLLHQLIDIHAKRVTDKYFAGQEVTYADVYGMSAEIVSKMLLDPIWSRRGRDRLGRFLRGQAAFRRSLVFTQIPFIMNNVVDTLIKGPWTAFITRSFYTMNVSEYARGLTLMDFGMTPSGQLLHDVPVSARKRWQAVGRNEPRYYVVDGKVVRETADQKRVSDLVQRTLAVTEVPAAMAGAAEDATKLHLAQHIYDGAKKRGIAEGLSEADADTYAKIFARDEVGRLWPTVGDGPIEQLFNQISPFLSYQFKNHTVFIGEFFSHPALFNYFDHIGDAIEEYNLAKWEETEDGKAGIPMPENLRRLIEIPWAPGLFIDLGQFSDAQHGLKPLFQAIEGKTTAGSLASAFVRLAGANDINLVLGILNTMNWGLREEWQQEMGPGGFGTGVWKKVEIPWEAPWGGDANWLNSFWPVEVGHDVMKFMDGKFTPTEVTRLAYQTAFFGSLKQYDRGAGINSFYWALREKDPIAAEKFLDEDPNGIALRAWWADHAAKTQAAYTPAALRELLNPTTNDRNKWLHQQTPWYQAKVHQGYEDLNNIRAMWDNVIWKMTPGTQEFRDARKQKNIARYEYFRTHPWMYEAEAMSKSPSDWAKELQEWETDDLVDTFFDMVAPKSEKFKSVEAYQKALKAWRKERAEYLVSFPTVAERLARTMGQLESVWRATEEGWFQTLDRIGTRRIAIEAAKQSKDYDLLDQLYLANELDYDQLNEDIAVHYFDPTTDFNTIPGGAPGREGIGPKTVRTDPFGNQYVERTKILPDFNKWRYDRMNMEEKAKFERDQKYAQGMKGIIAKAKASGNFGKTFFTELKKNPWLLNEYFRNNPGKREQWGANDDYFRLISRYGILAKAGKFDEAGRYFDNLPDWVKARYYEKHPERRQRAQQGLQYMNYMKRWVNFYKKRDYEGGAAFFEKLPKWVKDRYYGKHPEGFGRGKYKETPYSKAMGKWVKLLEENKDAEAKKWFDSMPKAFRDRYYSTHPEAKLRNDIKRTGQLGAYFAADDDNRAEYLRDNPEFAKWLKKQGDSESMHRMLVTAGYRAIPSDNQWLKRVYREKYPEVFSQEAIGERAVKKVVSFLAEHPEMTESFKKWMEAVLASYAEELKYSVPRPKPVVSDHSRQRRGRPVNIPHHGQSAAWVRLHSVA